MRLVPLIFMLAALAAPGCGARQGVTGGETGKSAVEADRPPAPSKVSPADIERVAPAEVKRRMSEENALLVCAYDTDDKFLRSKLEGAIPFSEFTRIKPDLPMDRDLIFYCA